jgi:hypothetical protein
MANKRISSLDDITLVGGTSTAEVNANDILPITDVDDTTGSAQGTTKAVKVSDLMGESPVQSVNTATGAVVLDADDIDDSSTSHKFVTASDITNLGNLSGTNSGDVTLATVANNYLSLSGQEITAGVVPVSLGGTGSGDLATARANLGLGTAATTASTDYASATHTHALDDLSDVSVSSPSSQDVVKWTGSQWEAGQVSVDVDTPLTTALRGTDNPHIGAYPNQSFNVTDNPYKSVMVIADADGNLEFVTKDGANVYVNTPSSRLALAKGFSVQEDGDEPDIEAVTPSGVTYSVISGDSDTKGANGLPTRQGFNYPDLGAYPAPILISGGTIA